MRRTRPGPGADPGWRMGIPEKSAFVVLVIVVTSVVTCALFFCREAPDLAETLRPVTEPGSLLPAVVPAVVPAVIVDEDDAATHQAPPTWVDEGELPDTQRWYRRRGLAPRWMMRTRETQLERARGAHVRRDDQEPELKVDLIKDTLQRRDSAEPAANGDEDADVR